MKTPPDLQPMRPPEPDRLTVSRSEAARMLGISERLLWTWTNAGVIPHVRIGTRVLYPVDQLREWLSDATNRRETRRIQSRPQI
jgi:excisionase family DNA binding protein